jgi:mRNA-degrading endonuclease toxin of MazEF toxin-antitoxin module
MMRRGEAWQVDIPFAPGQAQAGVRPAAIVQDDAFRATLPTVLIVPFTGSQRARRFPGTVFVQPDGQNGLRAPSVALVFQTRVLDQRHCLQRLRVLDPATLAQIFAELDKLTGR